MSEQQSKEEKMIELEDKHAETEILSENVSKALGEVRQAADYAEHLDSSSERELREIQNLLVKIEEEASKKHREVSSELRELDEELYGEGDGS